MRTCDEHWPMSRRALVVPVGAGLLMTAASFWLTGAPVVVASAVGWVGLVFFGAATVLALVQGTATLVLTPTSFEAARVPLGYRWSSRLAQRMGMPRGVYLNHTSVGDLDGLYDALRARLGLPEGTG